MTKVKFQRSPIKEPSDLKTFSQQITLLANNPMTPVYVTEKELEDGTLVYSMEYRNDLGNRYQITLMAERSYVVMDFYHILDGEVLEDTQDGFTMPANCAVALITMLNGVLAQVTEDKSRFS